MSISITSFSNLPKPYLQIKESEDLLAKQQSSYLCKLPLDIIGEIFSQLDFASKQRLATACKYLHRFHWHHTLQIINLNEFIKIYPKSEINPLSEIPILLIRGSIDDPLIKCFLDSTNLKRIRMIEVLNDMPISDLSLLSQMDNLEIVNLNLCKEIPEEQFANLPKLLRQLYIAGTKIKDLSAFSKMRHLEVVDLSWCKEIPEDQFANLSKSLRVLILDSTKIKDLSPLIELRYLEVVDLSWCKEIPEEQFANLPKLLRELYIPGTKIKDLSAFSKMRHLEVVDLSWCFEIPAEQFASLPKSLRELYIPGTKIKDLSPLFEMQHLKEVNLYATNIKNEQMAKLPSSVKIIQQLV